jgi:hypothetical protein
MCERSLSTSYFFILGAADNREAPVTRGRVALPRSARAESRRRLAKADYGLLEQDSRHPSLQFKKVGRYWSVRVGLRYRALAVDVGGGYLWFRSARTPITTN